MVFASLVAAGSFLLSGCATTWKVTGKCKTGGECEVGGEIGGTFQKSSGSIDVSQLAISVDSTGAFPSTGTLTVVVRNSAGSTMGSASFPWARSGNTIKVANPTTANAWLNTMSGATTAVFNLDPVKVQEQAGLNYLDVGLSYAGQEKAFQSTSWTSSTGCSRLNTYCSER